MTGNRIIHDVKHCLCSTHHGVKGGARDLGSDSGFHTVTLRTVKDDTTVTKTFDLSPCLCQRSGLCSCKADCHFSYHVGCKSRCWSCSLTLHPCLCADHPWSPWALRTVARLSHVEDLVSCGEPSAGPSPICQSTVTLQLSCTTPLLASKLWLATGSMC